MGGLRVVLDTNVVFSGVYSDAGASYQFLMRLPRKEIEPCLSVALVLEYEQALRDHLADIEQTEKEIQDILDYLCKVSACQTVFYLWRPFLRDPKDDMVLELAVASGARLVVTHNIKHFAGVERFGIRAITPAKMLRQLRGKR
jgi:putative PIN family toxin of toxin-antitoxin system